MAIIDTHCHFDAPEFDPDRDDVLDRARAGGVVALVLPAVTAATWPRLKRVAETPGIYPAYGLHPMFLGEHRSEHIEELRHWLLSERPVAVGECGLDFYVPGLDRVRQEVILLAQLKLAREFELPVIIHARRAVDEVSKHIRRYPGLRGVVHSFSGSLQQATTLFDLGFKLGIGGPITFERAQRLRSVVAALPIEALLLETDSPDQPGKLHRGGRNEPGFLTEVLDTIATLRQVEPRFLAAACNRNACELFGIDL